MKSKIMNLESRKFKFLWKELIWKYCDPPEYNALMRTSKYFYELYFKKEFYVKLFKKIKKYQNVSWGTRIALELHPDETCTQYCDVVIQCHKFKLYRWETFWKKSTCTECYKFGRYLQSENVWGWHYLIAKHCFYNKDQWINKARNHDACAFLYWYMTNYLSNSFGLTPDTLYWIKYVEYVLKQTNDKSLWTLVLRKAMCVNYNKLYEIGMKYIPYEERMNIIEDYYTSLFWNRNCTIPEVMEYEYEKSNFSKEIHLQQSFRLNVWSTISLTWKRFFSK
jgi:hypothetical protein